MKIPTKEQILKASEDCPDTKCVLKKLFPEAFEAEWVDVTFSAKLRAKGGGLAGVMLEEEDYFMPFTVTLTDTWKGDREDGNPKTDVATYKLKSGRIYRKIKCKESLT